ncbi:MAG: hypothetical protein NWQ54_01875 [Paraglaciecola sp.]|nr:hypothetical protein [Paraglaciecola sp.]
MLTIPIVKQQPENKGGLPPFLVFGQGQCSELTKRRTTNMKVSILIIVVVISVGFLFSFITTERFGLLVQFLVALGLFVFIGFFALISLMKKSKRKG